MGVTGWLLDKSAYTRLGAGPDAEEWSGRIERASVRVTTATRLASGFLGSFRIGAPGGGGPAAPGPVAGAASDPAVENRAIDVQTLLADRGRHRAPSVPDLLIAAVAELAGLTVLHLDEDVELIAEVTGQPVERLRTG